MATPVAASDPTSAWLTIDADVASAAIRLFGHSHYHAHAGVCGWANGIYWVEKLEETNDGRFVVRNCAAVGKRSVPEVTATVEADCLFDLVRPRDVSRWHAEPQLSVIVPYDHGGRVIPEQVMRSKLRGTWDFLKEFETVLRDRAGYRQLFERAGAPFYSVMDVGQYTFAPYKVCWPRIASEIKACVVEQNAVPQETVTLVECSTLDEAHFVCGMMNSSLFRFAARAYSQVGAKSFAAPHVLDNIELPRFAPSKREHMVLVRAVRKAASGRETDDVRADIDAAAGVVMGLTPQELSKLVGGSS